MFETHLTKKTNKKHTHKENSKKFKLKKNFNFSDKRLMNLKKKKTLMTSCRVHTNVCQFDYMRPHPLSLSDPAL